MVAPPSPTELKPTHLITFTVKAGGTALGATHGILGIEITRQVNRIPRATIILQDGSAAKADFAISSEQTLLPGAEIEILGGYSSTETTLFRGIVTRHRIELGPRYSRLVIEAKDVAVRMTLARNSRDFVDQTDADILEALIGAWPGLTADVHLVGGSLPQVVQHQASDWDFLVMRAEMNAAFVIVHDGKVSVLPPAPAGLPVARAIFGQGLTDARLELDAESQLAAVKTAAWDPAAQDLVKAESDDAATQGPGDVAGPDLAATGDATAELRHSGARDQAALDAWGAAVMARGRRAAVTGTLTVQGNELIQPGALIDLAGFGSHFSGTAMITGVRHRLGRGDWKSEVVIGADPRPHAERFPVAAPAAGGQLPAIPGLQIAKVVALEGDPAGEGRLQIRLPTITATEGALWARLSLPDAGKGRGFCSRPEIGDEVVVGFLDGDPRDPIVLGAMHSSAADSPLAAADDNHEKAIVTRSGMRLHWHDDTVTLTIDTPAGNSIVLDEDGRTIKLTDQNGNSIKLDESGITLDSPKDITLKAAGDVKVEGKAVNLKAQTSLAAEGASGAELKSSGTTVVKGSLVNIN